MSTYELRTYTLKSAASAEIYRAIWVKHIESLKAFGITTHGVFSVPGDPTKVIALVACPEGEDLVELGRRYMGSDLFKTDMADFDYTEFVSVDSLLLNPTDFSPLI